MWESDYKESWAPKNWCFWTAVLEKTLESPLDCKEIQPVHPKGDQSWVFIGRTDVEAETPILWPPHVKSWPIGKTLMLGGLGAGGEGDKTGWDGWMASLTWWAWVWVSSGSWWWTGRPGMLQFMGSQRVRYDWVTELNWTNSKYNLMCGFKRSFVTISQWMSCTSRRAFSLFCYVTLKDKCRGAVHLYSEKILTKTIILALVSWCQAHLTDNNEHTGSAVS